MLFIDFNGSTINNSTITSTLLELPGGTVDKKLPANAGDTGSIPGPGRFHIPWSNQTQAPQLLSPRAATAKACMPRACTPQPESSPCSQQLEKAHAQQRRPNAAKNI